MRNSIPFFFFFGSKGKVRELNSRHVRVFWLTQSLPQSHSLALVLPPKFQPDKWNQNLNEHQSITQISSSLKKEAD